MFIIGQEQYIIHSITYFDDKPNIIELISEDDKIIKRYAFEKDNEELLESIFHYQKIVKNCGGFESGGPIEMLYDFVEVIMKRLIEL